MRKLLFFCRVAFLCNICFLLAWLIQYMPVSPRGHIASTIVVLGTGLAFLLNILINIFVIFAVLLKKMRWPAIPRWLMIINFLFLLLQITILVLK